MLNSKTPTDLTEGSVFGAILSIFCVAFVLLLSGLEFYHYMTPECMWFSSLFLFSLLALLFVMLFMKIIDNDL